MIPYDDLVIALTAWRARQGLPVGQMSTALPPPGAVAAPIVHAASAGSGSGRAAPLPQRTSGSRPTSPPPQGMPDTHDESFDVDEAALIEEHHDLGAEGYPGETMLDGDLPAGDDTVNVELPMTPRAKPPAW